MSDPHAPAGSPIDPRTDDYVEAPGPNELRDPLIRRELRRATVWVGIVVAVYLAYQLAQPLLLIVGGLVFAAMLDGGARLLGRVLPIPRGWRIGVTALLALLFILAVFSLAGVQLAGQFGALKATVMQQIGRIQGWLSARGLLPPDAASSVGRELMGSVGRLTSALGTALGALSSIAMIVVLGLFIAAEPRIYERGLAWLLPMDEREGFYETANDMAHTLRRLMAGRLLGMAVEGVFVFIGLLLAGVPMALLLGVITGLLAFLPNIGSIISGALTILVGFSAGQTTGFLAMGIYLCVQTFDGYVVVPYVARRSVDLPPALILGMQLLLGSLFGILGLAFADPIVAMAKVALERKSEVQAEEAEAQPA